MVKKKTNPNLSSTPKKMAKEPPEPNVTPRKSPRLIAKAMNNLNSSSRKLPTQASVGDNIHVGSSQGIVDLENDEEQDRFWTKASTKVINLEEEFKATQESVYAPWTQPLLYSDGEDATEWNEFCNNFKEVSGGGPSVRGGRSDNGDQEDNSEDERYEQLLETDDKDEGN
ncbi:hypothetical protein MKX03_021371, partial [Papaver bracteatum]